MPEGLEELIIRTVRERIYGEVSVRFDQGIGQILIGIRLPSIGNNELAWTYTIDMVSLRMANSGNPAQEAVMRADRFAINCRRQIGEELVRQANAFREREREMLRSNMMGGMFDPFRGGDVGENLPWGTYAVDREHREHPEPPVTFEALTKTMQELKGNIPDKPALPKIPPKKRAELIHEDPFK